MYIPYEPTVPFLALCPWETCPCPLEARYSSIHHSTVWNDEDEETSVVEWKNKLRCSHMVEYYTVKIILYNYTEYYTVKMN